MRIFRFIILCQILIALSCAKEQINTPSANYCTVITTGKVLTSVERVNACNYTDVFIYRDKLYTICECCACDKSYRIVACDGNDLLVNSPERINDFRLTASYLYTVEGF